MNTANSRIEQAEQALLRAYLYLLDDNGRESVKYSRYAMQYAYLAFQDATGHSGEARTTGETLPLEVWALPLQSGVVFTMTDDDTQSALHNAERFVARVKEYLASHSPKPAARRHQVARRAAAFQPHV